MPQTFAELVDEGTDRQSLGAGVVRGRGHRLERQRRSRVGVDGDDGLVDRPTVGPKRDRHREHGQPDRDDVREVPRRAEHRRVPEDRPEAEQQGRGRADGQAWAEGAEQPPDEPHVDAAEEGRKRLGVGREAAERNEGDEHESWQRWERDQRPASRRAVRPW